MNFEPVEEVKEGEVYSTNETVIGKWIDGKPLYRKVVEVASIPSNNYVQTGVSNGSNAWIENGYVINSANNDSVPLNAYFSASVCVFTDIHSDASAIYCKITGMTITKAVFIIQYTKTTD